MSRSMIELLRLRWLWRWRSVAWALGLFIVATWPAPARAIDLADQPLFGSSSPPGNVLLALSVEFPTATSAAYLSNPPYTPATTYVGYFNSAKCYRYNVQSPVSSSYFEPAANAVGNACTSTAAAPLWSGNYLNWASTQTLDAFRWVLTGGTRLVDTATTTILQKTLQKHTDSGDYSFFPDRTIVESPSPSASGTAATPFNWGTLKSVGYGLGAVMQFTGVPNSCSFSTKTAPPEVSFKCTMNGVDASCLFSPGYPTAGNQVVCALAVTATPPPLRCTATVNSSNKIDYACTFGAAATPTCTATSDAVDFGGPIRSAVAGCSAGTPGVVVDYTNQSSAAGTATPSNRYQVYVQVKVCDPVAGLESNCTQYGSNYKPEGLIQKYASKLRFSAFSYLNDSSVTRDGGVMRARMKFVGPTIPQPGVDSNGNPMTSTNANAEWDAATGIAIANPDPIDADATHKLDSRAKAIVHSGVIGYVNNFGSFVTGDYKSNDPVSELYYAGLRYLRGQPNVPEYSSMANATAANVDQFIDAFPVITDWLDPILYSCQKNFILGIGDVNTHADSDVTGVVSSFKKNEPPTTPALVASDTAIDVTKFTNMVGTLEGITNLAGLRPGNGGDNSFFIAGLAYAAHTTDMRPDLPGTQTVDTFWLDVLEKQIIYPRNQNQYWLAAKYGGFNIPPGFTPFGAGNSATTLPISSWHSTADTIGTDLRPDNYFGAYLADKMRDALTAAFVKIEGSTTTLLTSTSTSSASPDIATVGSGSYSATYDPTDWSGVVQGSTLTFGSGNSPAATLQWDAAAQLDAAGLLPGNRRIATCCVTGGTSPGLAFRASALSATTFNAPKSYLSFGSVPNAGATQSAATYVDYLRGDHSQEVANGGIYRNRAHRLGDIVNAHLNPVGPPSQPYFDATNPGYGSFRRSYQARKTVVYAAANDGMLHAFDGSLPGGGAELFAYVPGSAYAGSGGAASTGLASLGNPTFIHHYLVDAKPNTYDVDFGNTPQATSAAADWHTVLIAGVGKGGKSYYAIDVTDPASWTSETAVAGKVLWEFSDSRMGFTFGDADVVRTKKYGWVVIVTSGYGNADGKGYFFFLDPRTGALLETLATPEGTPALPLDMGSQTAFLPDATDSLADSVYAGDMRGNVWRVDLTPASGSYDAPVKVAVATDAAGNAQPISTRPVIDAGPSSKKRYVFIGTGRLLGPSDLGSKGTQSFYAFVDGTAKAGDFRPAPVTATQRSDLSVVTDLAAGISTTTTVSPLGWYFDLGSSAGGVAERITTVPTTSAGVVYGAINQPVGVQCSASGTSRVFGLNFENAKSVLTDSSGTLVASVSIGSNVIDLAIKTIGGTKRLVVGRDPGIQIVPVSIKLPASLTRLNWREVPTAD